MGSPQASSTRAMMAAVDSAPGSTTLIAPKQVLDRWWSITIEVEALVSRSASAPIRLALAQSTATTRSTSRSTRAGGTSSSAPGSPRMEAGRSTGSAKDTRTSTPRLRSTCPSARPLPMVSASGCTWLTTATDRAVSNAATAARNSAPNDSSPDAGWSIELSASLMPSAEIPSAPGPCARGPNSAVSFAVEPIEFVGVGIAGGLRLGGRPRRRLVRGARPREQFLHLAGGVGHPVEHESQRRGELHTGARAHLRAQHSLGLVETGGSGRVIRLGVEGLAHDRVVHRGLAQITGDLRVGDRHETQPRVLDFVLDRGGHDRGDPLRESACPGLIHHGCSSSLHERALLDICRPVRPASPPGRTPGGALPATPVPGER